MNAALRNSGAPGPQEQRHRRERADPERRSREMEPVGDLGLPRRAGIDRVVSRHGQPAGEHDSENERRHERLDAVEQPREVDEREHEREDERHRHERVPEPRRRHRREIAVEEPPERQLQRVLGAERERDDAGVDRRERAETCRDRDPPLELARGTRSPRSTISRSPSAPIVNARPRNQIQRMTCSVRRRPACAVRVLDRRRRDRRRTSIRRRRRASRRRSPATAPCTHRASTAARCDDAGPVGPSRACEVLADAVQHADRVRQHLTCWSNLQTNRPAALA